VKPGKPVRGPAFGDQPIPGKPSLLLRLALRNLPFHEVDDCLRHIGVFFKAEQFELLPQIVWDIAQDHRSHAIMIA